MSHDILWSPNDKSLFILIRKQEIILFSIFDDVCDKRSSGKVFIIGTGRQFALSVLGIWKNAVHPQCVAWVPAFDDRGSADCDSEHLVAITISGGDIKLLSLHEYNPLRDRFGLHNKELVSKFPRNSVYLAWNPWKRNLLAQGVDRTRSLRDSTVIIWDVTKSSDTRTENQYDAVGTGIDVTFSSKQQGSPKLKQIYAVQSLIDSPVSHAEVMTCDRSLCDVGTQEVTSSFAWLSKSSFIVGMSGTSLKVFDLSDPSKPCQMTSTRAVHGLTVDPFCTTRIASYFESRVSIWKLNNLEKPVYTFTEQHDVCQIKWSPLKEAWLGVLVNDSSTIKLYYTYPMFLQPLEESEQIPLEHTVFPSGRSTAPLVSFSWHPLVADCLLTLDRDGCLDVAQIIKRAAITWSPEHTLLWTHDTHWSSFSPGGFKSSRLVESNMTSVGQSEAGHENPVTQESVDKIVEQSAQQLTNGRVFAELERLLIEDIAYVMQRRAEMGYGTAKDPTTYISLFRNDIQLRTMWVWIKYIQDYLTEFVVRSRVTDAELLQTGRPNGLKESGSRSRGATRCLGALAILSGELNQSGVPTPSEVLTCVDWQGVDARLPFPRYRSPERSHVLRLCMWRLDDTDEVQRRVFESVCAEGEYGRAATMALFNLKFNWALSFLNRATTVHSSQTGIESKRNSTNEILINQEVGLVSLALAGYTDSNNDLWRATCASLFNRLENPYLRVMFAFLTRQGGDFNVILHNEDLRLSDRLAFACLYLDDNELLTFVKNTCDQMVLAGRLEAVLLTGIASTEFISLVQNYVDLTGDVQTAAVVGLRACQLCCSSSTSNSRSMDCGSRRPELSGTRNAAAITASTVGEENIGRSSGRGAVVEKEAPLLLTLGGIRIAAWVQCYRDLLDQWRMWFCRADFDIANKVSLMSDYLTSSTSHSKSSSINPTTASCSPQSPTPGSNAASSPVGDSGPGGAVRENSKTAVHEALLGTAHRSANKPRLNVNLIAPVNQVFVACGFCGWRLGPQPRASVTSVGSGTVGSSGTMDCTAMVSTTSSSRSLQMHGGGGKHTICQRCRKPLPRCSICLMHLGTAALPLTDFSLTASTREDELRRSILAAVPTLTESMARVMQLSILGATGQEGIATTSDSVLRPTTDQHSSRTWLNCMTSLFIWCQACRHGGHASHLADWFHAGCTTEGEPSNTMCPVSGCSCRCATLDSLRPISSARCLVQPRGRTTDVPAPKVSSESVSEGEGEEEDEEVDEESDEDRIGFDDIILQGTYDTGQITQEANPITTSALCFAHNRSVDDFQRY